MKDLEGVFVSHNALQLVVESEALDFELSHHLIAVDGLGKLEFVRSLLLFCKDLTRKSYLILHFLVFSPGEHADAVLHILPVLLYLCCCVATILGRCLV